MAISNQKHSTIFGKEYTPPSDLFDDAYIDSISQYKDKSWYNRLLENPWLASKQSDYSPDFWSQFSENWMQDFSARDSYYADIINKRSQWLSDTLQQMHQQDYDSPIEQVQRESAAGINPDLAGNITPGSSSENDQPIQDLPMNQNSLAPNLFSLGNSILTSSMQYLSMFQNIKGASIENRIKSMNLSSSLKEATWQAISEGTGEFLNNTDDSTELSVDLLKGKQFHAISSAISNRISRLPYSRRNKRQMMSMVDDLIWSYDSDGNSQFSAKYDTMVNDLLSNLSKSRSNYAKSYGEIGGDTFSPKVLRFISNEIYKPINDLATQVDSLVLQNKKSYEKASRDTGVPGLKASAEASGYRLQGDILQVKSKITTAFKKINQKITGSSDLSPTIKLALEAGVASTEALVLSKLQIR